MAVDLQQRPYVQKPAPWDWQPNLTQAGTLLGGITCLIPFWEGAGGFPLSPPPRDLVTNTAPSTTTGALWTPGGSIWSPAMDVTSLTSALRWAHADYWARPSTAITVMLLYRVGPNASDGTGSGLLKKGNATGTWAMQQSGATAGRYIGRLRIGAADVDTAVTTVSPSTGAWYTWWLRWQSGQTSSLRLMRGSNVPSGHWAFSLEGVSVSPASGTLTWANEPLYVAHEIGNLNVSATVGLIAVWSRRLTDQELYLLNADPYLLLRPALPLAVLAQAAPRLVQAAAQAAQRTTTAATGVAKVGQAAGQAPQRTTTLAGVAKVGRVVGQAPQRTTTLAGVAKVGQAAPQVAQRSATVATGQRVTVVLGGPAAVAQRAATLATGRKLAAAPAVVAQRAATAAAAGAKVVAAVAQLQQRAATTAPAPRKLAAAAAQTQQRSAALATAGPILRAASAQAQQRSAAEATARKLATRAARVDQRSAAYSSSMPGRPASVQQRSTTAATARKVAQAAPLVAQRAATRATAGPILRSGAAVVTQRTTGLSGGRKTGTTTAHLAQRSASLALAGPIRRLALGRVDQRTATLAVGGLPPAPPTVMIRLSGREPNCQDLAGPSPSGAVLAGARGGGTLAGRRGSLRLRGSRPDPDLSGREAGR